MPEFQREYKFTLGQDMKRDSIQLVRSIYRANKERDKTAYLEEFLEGFEVLRITASLGLKKVCIEQNLFSSSL